MEKTKMDFLSIVTKKYNRDVIICVIKMLLIV